MPRAVLLLLLCLAAAECYSGKCEKATNCTSCVGLSSGRVTSCRWCFSTNSCVGGAWNFCKDTARVFVDCPVPEDSMPVYDENLARYTAMPLLAASYGDDEAKIQLCVDRVKGGKMALVKQYTANCNSKLETCSGIVAIDHDRKMIAVAFRGSWSLQQLTVELAHWIFNVMVDYPITGGRVFKYFRDASDAVWDAGLGAQLQKLKDENPDYELFITGYSLGGCMGTLVAARAVNEGISTRDKLTLITIGEPKIGNKDFAQGIEKYLWKMFRVTKTMDSISYWPSSLTIPFLRDDPPRHRRFQVSYGSDMSVGSPYKMCTRADDPDCAADTLSLPTGHTVYFEKMILGMGLAGCDMSIADQAVHPLTADASTQTD